MHLRGLVDTIHRRPRYKHFSAIVQSRALYSLVIYRMDIHSFQTVATAASHATFLAYVTNLGICGTH